MVFVQSSRTGWIITFIHCAKSYQFTQPVLAESIYLSTSKNNVSMRYRQRWRKKFLFYHLQMSWHFYFSHFLVLLKMQKTVLHKKLTCLQQNSEDMHRAGSPQMFLGMDFHRSQASTDHRKVLLCYVDKPVRHGKNLFVFSLHVFLAPEGFLQQSACSMTSKEAILQAMKNFLEPWK